MASKSKAQKLDLEVEKALEQALDIDFGDDLDIDMELSAFDEGFSVDDLEEQISRAAEELVAEQKTKTVEPVAVSPVETAAKVATITTASVIATPAAPPVPPVVKAAEPVSQGTANVQHKPANTSKVATPAPNLLSASLFPLQPLHLLHPLPSRRPMTIPAVKKRLSPLHAVRRKIPLSFSGRQLQSACSGALAASP